MNSEQLCRLPVKEVGSGLGARSGLERLCRLQMKGVGSGLGASSKVWIGATMQTSSEGGRQWFGSKVNLE